MKFATILGRAPEPTPDEQELRARRIEEARRNSYWHEIPEPDVGVVVPSLVVAVLGALEVVTQGRATHQGGDTEHEP